MISFKSFAKLTLVSIFLIIVAGSFVRMSGAGMGCPDWPKCFGLIIPPSSQDQIEWRKDQSYNEGQMIIYQNQLWSSKVDFTTKNEFDKLNWDLYTKHDYTKFNATHTWIEYINRLIGAISGVLTFIMLLWSLKFLKVNPKITYSSLVVVLLMGFQAWLGAVVVYSVLAPLQITIHMLMAFVIIVVMMYLINESSQVANRFKYDPTLNKFVIVVIVLSLIQVFLGTQVREQIDVISKSLEYSQRELWISRTNVIFKVHRSFAILLVLSNIVLWIRSRQVQFSMPLTNAIILVLMIEVMSGIVLSHFDMMRLMQPIHLVAASLLFVLQMGLYFQLRSAKTI